MTDETAETGSGIYRKLSPRLFTGALIVLWALGGYLLTEVWQAQRGLIGRVTTLEAQRNEDVKNFDTLREDIKEMRNDIKELLREVRK